MSQVLIVLGPVSQASLEIKLRLICTFSQAAHMRVLADLNGFEQSGEGGGPIALELAKAMVNDSHSLLGNVVAHIGKELEVVDAQLVGEVVFDDADLLGGQEDTGCVGQQIECML